MSDTNQQLFLEDSYIKEHDAVVTAITDDGIQVDKVLFYPRGGGQPDDKGVVVHNDKEYEVTGIRKEEGNLVLLVDGDFSVGDKVVQKIDWDYRYRLMKHHTSLHVLSAVVWDKFEAKVTGGTIYENKARLDFDLAEFNKDMAQDLVAETNKLLQQGLEVDVKFVPRDEAEKDPNLIRTKINLLPKNITELRLVKIGDVDIQADGGLHVKNTDEIGEIELLKTENKGKGRKRISIGVKL